MLRRTLSFLSLSALALLFAPGCVGYHAYPPIEGYPALSNPNQVNVQTVTVTAMKWVLPRYAPDGTVIWDLPHNPEAQDMAFSVNMPVGVKREVYLRSVGQMSPNARPLTPETADLPTYHIVRVWIAGDEAKVDLIRPLPDIGASADGSVPTQGLTVNLRGGFKPWHVTAHKRWAVGAMEMPQAYYLPEATGREAYYERAGVEDDPGSPQE